MRDGKRLRTNNLDLRVVVASAAVSRIGFVVPKHGHSSVERNRLKRRLRELSRLRVIDVMGGISQRSGVDVVIRAQPGAYRLEYVKLGSEIELLRARLQRFLREGIGGGRAGEAAQPPSS